MLRATLKLQDAIRVAKDLGRYATSQVNFVIQDAADDIEITVKNFTRDILTDSSFFRGFVFGTLRGELGIPATTEQTVLQNVIESIVADLEFVINPLRQSGGKVSGGIQIRLGREAWNAVINLPQAKVITDKGQELEWLRWVLKEGDKVVVSNWHVQFITGRGRSGLALMRRGEFWRVPSEFSGTTNDNWITRQVKRNLDFYNLRVSRIVIQKLNSRFQ